MRSSGKGLRDIEARLRSLSGKFYRMGLHGEVARSTLRRFQRQGDPSFSSSSESD